MVAFTCMRYLHTAELAYVLRSLFVQIEYERVQVAKMESMFIHAILYEKEFGGMGLDDLFAQESLPGMTTSQSSCSAARSSRARSSTQRPKTASGTRLQSPSATRPRPSTSSTSHFWVASPADTSADTR